MVYNNNNNNYNNNNNNNNNNNAINPQILRTLADTVTAYKCLDIHVFFIVPSSPVHIFPINE